MTDEPIKLSKDTSLQLCVVCSKPVSDGHDHDNSIRDRLDEILDEVPEIEIRFELRENLRQAINAYILGEVMELIGKNDELGADGLRKSDGADMNYLRQELRNKANKKFGVQE